MWSEAAGGLVAGCSDGSVWVGGGGGVEGRRLEGRAQGSAVTAIARLVCWVAAVALPQRIRLMLPVTYCVAATTVAAQGAGAGAYCLVVPMVT